MPYNLRKPIGPVEQQLLAYAKQALADFPGVRFVNFVIPPLPEGKPDFSRPPTPDDGATIYTIDRSPVADLWGRPLLVITVRQVPFLLFSPHHNMIAEKV